MAPFCSPVIRIHRMVLTARMDHPDFLRMLHNIIKMKAQEALAMVFEKVNQPFLKQDVSLPELQAGEVLVRIDYTTICTSDLHTFYGRRGGHCPSILGHEIIGTVLHTGPGGVKDYHGDLLQTGDPVTWSVYAHDHQGEMARKGLPQKSADLYKYGHEKFGDSGSLNGGFATHCQLRAGTDIYKLPAALSLKEAAPLNCTHATIAGALRLAGDLQRKNVLIIGAGMLGLSACAMAREGGASRVYAMDIQAARLEKALSFGVDAGLDGELSVETLKEKLSPEGGIDVVIETSGVPTAMEKGIELLNIGGINVWVGAVYAQRDLAINAEKIVRRLQTIKGLHNYIPADLAEAIRFLKANHLKYPFEQLVSTEFPLPELDSAFTTANKGSHYRVGIFSGKG